MAELFSTESIFVEDNDKDYLNGFYMLAGERKRVYTFTVIINDVPTVGDTENFLDDCVILNTYRNYFIKSTGFEDLQIACGIVCYESRFEMSLNCKNDIIEKKVQFYDSLIIDELVKINTNAKNRLKDTFPQNGFYPYNVIFTKLNRDLEKMI
ncbi:MAG: hypothetical protein NC517_04980 [Firmicutes bacterium]|nr:hypothetical protein [Bacillota bacterium]